MSNFWTSMPKFFGDDMNIKNIRLSLTLLLCTVLLSSCGPVLSYFDKDENASKSTARAQNAAPSTIAPMSPPGADNRPPLPGQAGTQYTPDGLPALQPARGVNANTLFAENISDTAQRIQRVENAVIELRNDFDAVSPSIVRLVAVEKDMQDLVKQLQTLLRNEPPTTIPSVAATQMPQSITSVPSGAGRPTPPPQTTIATPVSGGNNAQAIPGDVTVKGLRIGEHTNKTRLVFDVSGPATYRYDLDNGENLLVIEMPNAGWSGRQSWSSKKSPLLSSYSVQPAGDKGSRVIIQLKKPAKVIYESTLKPNGNKNYRIVLDLAAM